MKVILGKLFCTIFNIIHVVTLIFIDEYILNPCFFVLFFSAQLVNNNTVTVSSSTYYDYDASRAVDGNFDQNITNCSHTDDICYYGDHAWLRIDLKKEYSIKSVKIWYRADSKYHSIFPFLLKY